MSQPENEKVYSLRDYVSVCSETTDWFIYVMSEINDHSKEVKVMFMKKSGQYILLSKKLEKWFPKSAIFHIRSIPYHPLTIPCVIPLIPSILKVYVIKKHEIETSRWTFIFVNHSSNEFNKKEVVDIDKKFNCLQLRFSQTIECVEQIKGVT